MILSVDVLLMYDIWKKKLELEYKYLAALTIISFKPLIK